MVEFRITAWGRKGKEEKRKKDEKNHFLTISSKNQTLQLEKAGGEEGRSIVTMNKNEDESGVKWHLYRIKERTF